MTEQPIDQTYIVRAGSDGEALVTAPSGRMRFMGPWALFKFVISTSLAAHKAGRKAPKFEVQDD